MGKGSVVVLLYLAAVYLTKAGGRLKGGGRSILGRDRAQILPSVFVRQLLKSIKHVQVLYAHLLAILTDNTIFYVFHRKTNVSRHRTFK